MYIAYKYAFAGKEKNHNSYHEEEEQLKMTDIGVRGLKVKFQNRLCSCHYRKKAEVRISKSDNNPGRLYFRCADDRCGFFEWWRPTQAEILSNKRDKDSAIDHQDERIDKVLEICNVIGMQVQKINNDIIVCRRILWFIILVVAVLAWKQV